MRSRAEDNRAWIRRRIGDAGLTEEISRLAYLRFIARYVNNQTIDERFLEIVGSTK